ncbi:DNA translocase FtsK [bacterium]|nr:DNA translocase FtsK [bacterium]
MWTSAAGVILCVASVLLMVSFLRRGELLVWLNNFLVLNFGAGALVLPFLCLHLGLICFQTTWIWSRPPLFVGTLLFFAGLTGMTGQNGSGAGVDVAAWTTMSRLITAPGAWLFFAALMVGGLLILWQVSVKDMVEWYKKIVTEIKVRKAMAPIIAEGEQEIAFVGQEHQNIDTPEKNEVVHTGMDDGMLGGGVAEVGGLDEAGETALSPAPVEPANNFAKIALLEEIKKPEPIVPVVTEDGEEPVAVRPPWQYPTIDIFEAVDGGEADRGDINANAQIIENTLDSFGIRARVVEINRGPSVTQYALEIAMGTKLSKVVALAGDLALALAAPTGQIRIEAPIAGKSLVGIEVPNRRAAFVTLRKMLSNKQLSEHPSKLAVAMGIDVNGQQIVGDIAKFPHVLIAGATGSGKSVGINSFLCSLLFRCSPEELRLILVDPKRVELTIYQDIPHLLTPVIVDANKVVSALKWACAEMDRRYQLLADNGVRNIDGFNAKSDVEPLPKIVIVIDEFADIMMFAPSDVEESITRLAQMARAVGIHLVLATQRPSVNVITGLIKANIPTRIAFNVASVMDSRVVLDTVGAEKLLGHGDMLYIPPDQAKPIRVQGTLVSDADAKKLADFTRSQGWQPDYLDDVTSKYRASSGKGKGGGSMADAGDTGERDELFMDAVKMFAQYDQASSSMIQRRLSVGYARAARILDQLCEAGIVGPAKGSKPRDVNRETLNAFLSDPNNLS